MTLIPSPVLQFSDGDGHPYAGGSVATFDPGTFQPRVTYVDANGTVPNANPIILSANGTCVCYGSGRYRMILRDAGNNLIFDSESESYLGDSAISAVMLPVTMAATLAEARRRMGIDDAIALAVANLSLMPGPTGPQGAQGPVGPQGPAGSQGAQGGSDMQIANGNPGYAYFPASNFLLCFGANQTGANGTTTIGYGRHFSSVLSVQVTPTDNAINLVARTAGITGDAFSVLIEDTNNTRGFACNFRWSAIGFG